MATYKVLQDIEAEDKFLGPLTLKQFIYASIAAVCCYISFFALTKGVWLVAVAFLPVILFSGFLAWPWNKDQSNEVWLLAKIRFALKPRRRIWDQSGVKELVTITAPKQIDRQLTDGFSQTEVRSRLQALANTLDSRGWAVKNVNINLFSEPSYVATHDGGSDRLIDPGSLPQDVPTADVTALDDVLDEQSNPTAQHFDQMMQASAAAHRQQAVQHMQQATQAQSTPAAQQSANYWFMNEPSAPLPPGSAAFGSAPVIAPGTAVHSKATNAAPTAEEQALLKKLHEEESQPDPTNYHLRTIPVPGQPTAKKHSRATGKQAGSQPRSPSTATPDPAILELANNDDLNVATIARQADKARNLPPDDEVVVSLR